MRTCKICGATAKTVEEVERMFHKNLNSRKERFYRPECKKCRSGIEKARHLKNKKRRIKKNESN